ncbi:LysR family transcriptional regulator [Halothiobacillus sp.]|uniref:LysR family transcriptional regulator n=1 Tax=Halothiobacillus sp. TaxID=1891311 RepID=UPI0026259BD1|nr:LysR family transcriptional regulator [Halothiobacillus sp.]
MDDLRPWRWLIGVIDLGGLQAAADHFHRTPSTLSHAIKQLEVQVGLPLVAYQGRRLILTEIGQRLTCRMRPVLRDLDGAQALANKLTQGVEPTLSIAIDQIVPFAPIQAVLTVHAERYPQTRIELYETVLGGGPAMMKSGAIGLYIGTEAVTGLLMESLDCLKLVPCAARTHPLAQQADPVSDADLRRYRQIVIRDSAPGRLANGSWLSAEQRFSVDHLHTAIGLIESGLGFAWLPEPQIASHPMLRALRTIDAVADETDIRLAYTAGFAAGKAGAHLIDTIRARFKD